MSDCLFCRIVAGDVPSKKVFEDEATFAFEDVAPRAPTHVLIVPREHVDTIATASDEALVGRVFLTAARVARERGLDSYRLVVNNGPDAGQTVFHLHVHLLGGRTLSWPPG
ncbi:MAG TPA: histidine triad nucleotide-binding protein [Thermoanaerobaculia bacterium]|jgi:histidine triad (HIT) family protein|nr:histidine triad nucleotide-binding protein [Thermoanaerobaculia bacterium]